MYAYATDERLEAVDFQEPEQLEELHYWRKHPNLHGWMEALYEAKGGKDPEFNLSAVKLEGVDLDRLEADVRKGKLPETSGFFFGVSSGSDEEHQDDLEFIRKARQALARGKSVFYVAWW
jgi:hypothetical protein